MTGDRRREPLYDPLLSAGRYQRSAFGRAVSPLEALVVCEPGNEPEESVLEQLSLRDAVADALSVEAVPRHHADGTLIGGEESKALHTTMQTLGRFALITGLIAVAVVNIVMFDGVEALIDLPADHPLARLTRDRGWPRFGACNLPCLLQA